MHGRLKVKTTKEQEEEKQKERLKKLAIYRAGTEKVFEKRKNEQYDRDVLLTTQQLLSKNPDFFTLWNFRKEILLHLRDATTANDLDKLIKEELSLTESCLHINPKSYCTWHQRCWILTTMSNPDWQHELKLCNQYLEHDERNFHCWDYRRFVVQKAQIPPKDELDFTMQKINANFSNYSSWHYRSKLLPLVYPQMEGDGLLREDKYLEELELVQNAAFTDPNDQSAWFYHRWLLGRNVKPLAIRSIYINRRTSSLIVSLTQELMVNSNAVEFQVTINGNELLNATWKPSDSKLRTTSVWFLELADNLLKTENVQQFAFQVTLKKHDEKSSLDVVLDADADDAWNQNKTLTGFRLELSTAASNVLHQELESCQQLQEFEPDNKWMLLTSVLLMRAIDPNKFAADIDSNLLKLTELDIFRKHYYEDLRSKFILEDVASTLPSNAREVNINNCHLSALYHMDYLTQIAILDVSNNQLRSLNALHPLQSLRKLVADSNSISSCAGIETLHHLEYLSLANNKIETEHDLKQVRNKHTLNTLVLKENSVCENKLALTWIQENLHFITDLVVL